MEKRRTTFFYVAAFFLIVGIGSFITPLFGKQVILFRWMGDYTLIGQIAFIALGAVALVIGFIRFFTGPKPAPDKKPEDKPNDGNLK
jgi:hypothetical protein